MKTSACYQPIPVVSEMQAVAVVSGMKSRRHLDALDQLITAACGLRASTDIYQDAACFARLGESIDAYLAARAKVVSR